MRGSRKVFRWVSGQIVIGVLVGIIMSLGLSAGAEEKAPAPRKARRLTTYSPPVIPHDVDPETACLDCHGEANGGMPTMPHQLLSNCRQCHVPQAEKAPFRRSRFQGAGDPKGDVRLAPGAPPLMPHRVKMRERCLACHGPEAREDILHTPHPHRARCLQCHVEQVVGTPFRRGRSASLTGQKKP